MAEAGDGDGKPGDDRIIDETGAARINGGSGNDSVVKMPGEGFGGGDYKGGSGRDTLEISLTSDEWLALAPSLQSDLDAFLAQLAANTNPSGQAKGNSFHFGSLGLDVNQFESVRLVVDGVELTPQDDPVTAVDDAFATDNETVVSDTVLANDSVPDLVASVDLLTDTAEGDLTLNSDGTFSFDPGADFDDLTSGEFRTVMFEYQVTDANGNTGSAWASIEVEGTNAPPEANDDLVGTYEDFLWKLFSPLNNDCDPDGNGGTAIATMTIEIPGQNDLPFAPHYSLGANEDTGFGGWNVLIDATDPDLNDSLRFVALQGTFAPFSPYAFSETVTSAGGHAAQVTLSESGDISLATYGNFEHLAAGESDFVSVS